MVRPRFGVVVLLHQLATGFCPFAPRSLTLRPGSDRSRTRVGQRRSLDGVIKDAARLPKWRTSSTRLDATTARRMGKGDLPGWKVAQNKRYAGMFQRIFDAVSNGDDRELDDAVAVLEQRQGKPRPARSSKLLGKWRLAYAAPVGCATCACSKDDVVVAPTAVVGTHLDLVAAPGTLGNCQLDGRPAGNFRSTSDTTLTFTAVDSQLDGINAVTYVDDNVLLLRRARCGKPLLLFERVVSR